MLLSNPTARADNDQRALTQLGDSLMSRGLLYSAQFCYVCAGLGFTPHPLAPLSARGVNVGGGAPPRLALLLADARASTLPVLATNRAIFATEVYEYALSLSMHDYVINELQVYKLMVACRLCDAGEYERALAYAEAAARGVLRAPRSHAPALLLQIATLADRLKYHDPALAEEAASGSEAGSAEPSPRHQQWQHDLTGVARALQAEAEAESAGAAAAQPAPAPAPVPQHHGWPDQEQQAYQQQTYQGYQSYDSMSAENTTDYPQYYAGQNRPASDEPDPPGYGAPADTSGYGVTNDANRYTTLADPAGFPVPADSTGYATSTDQPAYAEPYWQPSPYADGEGGIGATGGVRLPGAPAASRAEPDDDRPPSAPTPERESETPKGGGGGGAKPTDDKTKSKGGWLSGILRLGRAPNQMILPDDKNPSIVWDEDRKRWRNVDGDVDEPAAPPPPPRVPLPTPAAPSQPLNTGPAGAPPPAAAAPTGNAYKMTKSRHIKKSYVDVFNPSGAAAPPLPPAADVLGPPGPAPLAAPPAYFVPAPTSAQSGGYGDGEAYRGGL